MHISNTGTVVYKTSCNPVILTSLKVTFVFYKQFMCLHPKEWLAILLLCECEYMSPILTVSFTSLVHISKNDLKLYYNLIRGCQFIFMSTILFTILPTQFLVETARVANV